MGRLIDKDKVINIIENCEKEFGGLGLVVLKRRYSSNI